MEPNDLPPTEPPASAPEPSGRWRALAAIDEPGGVWLADETAAGRLVWLIRLSDTHRADRELVQALGNRLERLAAVQDERLGLPVTGWQELEAAGEIGFAVPQGRLWGDVFPLAAKRRWSEVKPWAVTFARLLQAAAGQGMVDGGLHPARLWLAEDRRVLVPGFGLGSLLQPPTVPDARQIWLSPQAVDGFPVSPADDLYSLGALLHQALTGSLPLNPENLIFQIRYTTPPPPAKAGAFMPIRLSDLIATCLAKDPAQRPKSAEALVTAFDATDEPAPQVGRVFAPVEFDPAMKGAVDLPPPPVMAAPRSSFFRAEVWLAVFVFATAIGLGGWMLWASWPKEDDGTLAGIPSAEGSGLTEETNPPPAESFDVNAFIAAATNRDAVAAPTTPASMIPDFPDSVIPAAPAAGALRGGELDPTETERIRAASEREADAVIAAARRRAEEMIRRETEEADKKARTALAAEEARFRPLFNGRDLEGWQGDTAYWSVRDGLLTGWIGADAAPGTVAWLTSTHPSAEDFELRGQFRLRALRDNRAASAAVLYRATAAGRDGYEFLLGFDSRQIGSLVGDSGRGVLAAQGREVTVRAAATPATQESGAAVPGIDAARAALRMNDWNEFRIIARGNTLTHQINGHVVATVTDETRFRPRLGAVSLRVGGRQPAMIIQFRDLKLRRD